MSRYHLLLVLILALIGSAVAPAQTGNGQKNGSPAPVVNNDYKLGPGDEFRVIVQHHEELSGDYLVPEGGVVVFPQIGATKVQGSTILELTHILEKRLNAILFEPSVAVVLRAQRARYVTVIGDVQHPMPVPFIPSMRLADAVTAAGGLVPEVKANECDLTVIHGGDSRTVHFLEVLADPEKNYQLSAGDTVNVDSGVFTVYVVGQVRAPGLQRLKRGAGLVQALASAGGATESGATDRVHVTSLDGTERDLDLSPTLSQGESQKLPALRSGDLIVVPVSTARFYVLGYVLDPGVFQIPPGHQVTLAEALSMAKGQDSEHRGRMSKVLISRNEGGKPQHFVYDFGKFLHSGDPTCNPTIRPGDIVYVPESRKVAPTTAASLATALASLAVLFRL